jgi:hypothetical protein
VQVELCWTHSLNAPGFNPCTCHVTSWCQAFAFKCNLYRYTEDGDDDDDDDDDDEEEDEDHELTEEGEEDSEEDEEDDEDDDEEEEEEDEWEENYEEDDYEVGRCTLTPPDP